MSSYVRNKYLDLSSSFHLTPDDVNIEMDSYSVKPRSIASRSIFRRFDETGSAQYVTYWDKLEKTSLGARQDLEQYGKVVERYWTGEPK